MYRTSIDSKGVISRLVENEITRLCREDGFRLVSLEGVAHLAMEEPHRSSRIGVRHTAHERLRSCLI